MRIRRITGLATVWALSLGWLVPAYLGFSAFLDCMRRGRHSISEDEMAYGIACTLLARDWFLLAAGVWVVVAGCGAFRHIVTWARRREQPGPL